MTIERPMFPPRREDPDTYDAYGVQDTFCTALLRVERVGPCVRLYLVSREVDPSGKPQNTLVGKVVVPAEALPAIAALLLQSATTDASLALAAAGGPAMH